VFSVAVDRADIAQRGAFGAIFALYLIESLAASTEQFEPLKFLSPTYYYAPTEILVRESYAVFDAAVLGGMIVVLLLGSQRLFNRRDI
jgi:ABC-2 type transport system permease protein